jgi:integrase
MWAANLGYRRRSMRAVSPPASGALALSPSVALPPGGERRRLPHTYCPGAGREDFLFLAHKGTHPLRNGFSRDILKPALRRAGLGERRITWLSLRHTAASLMFDAGLTLFDVQRRLGHKSPTMTAEVYTHLMRERFEEGRAVMERYMRDADV